MLLVRNMQKYTGMSSYAFSTAQLNYYQVLGLQSFATQQEILSSYSRLASQYFPSVSSSGEAISEQVGTSFRKVSEAYAVLSHQESRNNYDLMRQKNSQRVYASIREQENKHYKTRDSTGHLNKQAYPQGSYAQERQRMLAEERAKFNVDFLGRYKGGLPQKGKGIVRGSIHGSSLGPVGGFHDTLVHTEKTNQYPDQQHVTNEMAQDFGMYQDQSRESITRRWPAFQATVDYDYFKFNHYQYGFRFIRNMLIIFAGLPFLVKCMNKWTNKYALYKYNKSEGENVEAFGRKIVVGSRGAVKYA